MWSWAFWHGVVDLVGVVATVAAAGLAGWAIKRGNEQSRQSLRAIAEERRLDFQIEQLLKLLAIVEGGGLVAHWRAQAAFLLRLLPADERDLDRVRALVLDEHNGAWSEREVVRRAEIAEFGAEAAGLDGIRISQEFDGAPSYQTRMGDDLRRAISRRVDAHSP